MRRSVTIILLLLSVSLFAHIRTADEAAQKAAQWLQGTSLRRSPAMRPVTLQLASTYRQQNEQPAFYVFNRGAEEGFVIVAADDRCQTVLGYADEGYFDAARVPQNMRMWLEHYQEEISQISASATATPHLLSTSERPAVKPLLNTIAWDQLPPYNNLCPIDADGERCVTGCIATAAAQIMRYWQYPERGEGTHSYVWTNSQGEKQTLEADFESVTFDWENMRASYMERYDILTGKIRQSYSEEEATAVATLMAQVGIACNTNYHSSGSSSFSTTIAEALRKYFKYDKGLTMLYKDCMSWRAFKEAFREELQAGRPILMTAQKAGEGGHAFICDGVDENGLFHINWGWGGYSNGYFELSVLDPEYEGTGSAQGEGGYVIGIDATIGIQPDRGSCRALPFLGATNIEFLPLTVARDSDMGIDIANLINYGPGKWDGYLAVNVYQNGECVMSSDLLEQTLIPEYKGYHVSGDDAVNFSTLPNGKYRMIVEYNGLEDTIYRPVYSPAETQYFDVVVAADSARVQRANAEKISIATYAVGPGRVFSSTGSQAAKGEDVKIDAVPMAGAQFLHWTSTEVVGDTAFKSAQLILTPDTDIVLTAVFGYDDAVFDLHYGIDENATGTGTVVAKVLADEVENIYVEADEGTYPANCQLAIYAIPDEGCYFNVWNKAQQNPIDANPRRTMLYDSNGFYADFVSVTALDEINEPLDTKAPMYNILGMPIDADYRGVVIQNQHKYIRL